MQSWTIDQLKAQLNQRPLIKSWAITQEHVHRRERYFLLDPKKQELAIDQDRDVHSQDISLKIAVKLGDETRQGEINKKLFPSLPMAEQLDAAIAAAVETDHQAWTLPASAPRNLPQMKSADPRMEEDLEGVMTEMTQSIAQAVSKKRDTIFNSSELFLSVHDREMHLSNGLTHRSSQSRIYAEAAYSFMRTNAQGEKESDEYLNTQWAVHREDIRIDRLFEETSDRAEHSLEVIKPLTGSYPVIIDADVLSTLLNGFISQLSGSNAYNGLPFIKPDAELIPGATKDKLTMKLDPQLPYGADTGALSSQGIAQSPLTLVEDNIVRTTATDKQYADYLKITPTTVRGDLVVDGGLLSYDELKLQGPQVLEILQFSGLFADPNSGTFGSEIRLAKLYDNRTGRISYVKGGSLSGSIKENFKGLRLSNRQVKRAHFESAAPHGSGYFGPDYALLSDVSIVG